MKKSAILSIPLLTLLGLTSCKFSATYVDPYTKTDFVTVIPKGQTVTVPDNPNTNHVGDVFWEKRTITLSSYEICKYEVTQALYKHVMGKVPYTDEENRYGNEVQDLRPVVGVNFYEAAIFCNKLSELKGYEPVYKIENIKYGNRGKPNQYVRSADVSWDLSKNGYRLPTEAEWEFAARGGAKSKEDWNYRYSGSDNSKKVAWTMLNSSGYSDEDEVLRSHEVGLKAPNALGIYDMSGNVGEICFDYFRTIAEDDDFSHGNAVKDFGNTTDPLMPKGKYDNHVIRGGSYRENPGMCSNNQRISTPTYGKFGIDGTITEGFRLARRP